MPIFKFSRKKSHWSFFELFNFQFVGCDICIWVFVYFMVTTTTSQIHLMIGFSGVLIKEIASDEFFRNWNKRRNCESDDDMLYSDTTLRVSLAKCAKTEYFWVCRTGQNRPKSAQFHKYKRFEANWSRLFLKKITFSKTWKFLLSIRWLCYFRINFGNFNLVATTGTPKKCLFQYSKYKNSVPKDLIEIHSCAANASRARNSI